MGGMPPLVTSRPLIRPMTRPPAMQNSSIMRTLLVAFSTQMPKPPSIATWEPTEMSIRPAPMTMVMPMAMRPIIQPWTNRLEMLPQVKKLGFTAAPMKSSTMKDSTKLYSPVRARPSCLAESLFRVMGFFSAFLMFSDPPNWLRWSNTSHFSRSVRHGSDGRCTYPGRVPCRNRQPSRSRGTLR